MPNCLKLLRDGIAVPLVQIDEEMCRHFGEPIHPRLYFRAWYECIGWNLAMGRSFEEIRAIYADPEWADSGLSAVAQWLEAHFTPQSWHEISSPRGNQ